MIRPIRRCPDIKARKEVCERFSNGHTTPSSKRLSIPLGTTSTNDTPRKLYQVRRKNPRPRSRRIKGDWLYISHVLILLLLLGFLFCFGIFLSPRVFRLYARGERVYRARHTNYSKNGKETSEHHSTQSQGSGVHPFHQFTESAPNCTEPLPSDDVVTFTLVTQLSEDRLWMMEHHCQRWSKDGALFSPMSIAVFTQRSVEEIQSDLIRLRCPLKDLTVQTVSGYSDENYPVNALRNSALRTVKTTHVVYVDIDFWESDDLFQTLQLQRNALRQSHKTALVIPAFQLNRQCHEWRDCRDRNVPLMPKKKSALLDLVFDHHASTFDPTNTGGHGSTKYGDWFDQEQDELIPIECFQSNRYEPYLVFRYCRDLPPFPEAFTGYGKNKMTWVMHLRRAGWRFLQLGQSFVVHYPHLDSKSRMHWNGGDNGLQLSKSSVGKDANWTSFKRGQIDQTFVQFRQWLDEIVQDETVVPLCKNAEHDDERLWVDPKQLNSTNHKD